MIEEEVLLRVPAATRGERDIVFGWTGEHTDEPYMFVAYAQSPGYECYPVINIWRNDLARCVPYLTKLYLAACKGYPLDTKQPFIVRDSGKRELFRIAMTRDAVIFQSSTKKFRISTLYLQFVLKFFESIVQND